MKRKGSRRGKPIYREWTRIPWDGNPDLKLECWRKSFGRGHVSVGIGEFQTVAFSFGADSASYSSTRWTNYDDPPLTEEAVMKDLDRQWKLMKRFPGCYRLAISNTLHTGRPKDREFNKTHDSNGSSRQS